MTQSIPMARGFALIEAIFAASFIITIVVVLFEAMTNITQFNAFSKEQAIGRYLLQDTEEMIVARQQYNLVRSTANWYYAIGDDVSCTTGRCMMATTSTGHLFASVLQPCNEDSCRLYFDTTNRYYTYYQYIFPSIETPFYRYVTIEYEDFDGDPLTYEAITYDVTVEWFQDRATTSLKDQFTLYHL